MRLRCASSARLKPAGCSARWRAARRRSAPSSAVCLAQLDAGDVLMVTRLDHLGRSTRDLLNTLAAIASNEAGFRSLGDAWADTTTPQGRLMLTVLGGLAEFERELIRARTIEGRARAKARAVKLGRKPKLMAHQQREAACRRDAGEAIRDIDEAATFSHSTIPRLSV